MTFLILKTKDTSAQTYTHNYSYTHIHIQWPQNCINTRVGLYTSTHTHTIAHQHRNARLNLQATDPKAQE